MITHGFFFVIGGFTLHDSQGTLIQLHNFRVFKFLVNEGELKWPMITQNKINSRKIKGLHFLNAVLFVQIVWFIYQVIYHGANRLLIAHIEVVMLAYIVLASV